LTRREKKEESRNDKLGAREKEPLNADKKSKAFTRGGD